MKLISWNVNGIRAVMKKDFPGFLKKEKPDALCLQEVKISTTARLDASLDFPGYREYWHSATRPGYSGTAILVRDDVAVSLPAKEEEVNILAQPDFDNEGRTQCLEFADFYLVNVYFPNANNELSRLPYKMRFNADLQARLKTLEKQKPVIICGDYNVAHMPIDLARPKENEGEAGYTEAERGWMNGFIADGFIDTFRELHPDKVQYSWWSYRAGARQRNVGWRIDYFCISESLRPRLQEAFILDHILGSDHAPVGMVMN
jgi:exodeoxyribonuclease-3